MIKKKLSDRLISLRIMPSIRVILVENAKLLIICDDRLFRLLENFLLCVFIEMSLREDNVQCDG